MKEDATVVTQESKIEVNSTRGEGGLVVLEGTINEKKLYLALLPSSTLNSSLIPDGMNGDYSVVSRSYYGQSIFIAHSEIFQLHKKPIPSQSANLGSETEYAGQTENKEIALQILRQGKQSRPPHRHNGVEYYHHVKGTLVVKTLDLESGLEAEETLSGENPLIAVPEGFVHQVKAEDDTAISLLVCDFNEHIYHSDLDLFE